MLILCGFYVGFYVDYISVVMVSWPPGRPYLALWWWWC